MSLAGLILETATSVDVWPGKLEEAAWTLALISANDSTSSEVRSAEALERDMIEWTVCPVAGQALAYDALSCESSEERRNGRKMEVVRIQHVFQILSEHFDRKVIESYLIRYSPRTFYFAQNWQRDPSRLFCADFQFFFPAGPFQLVPSWQTFQEAEARVAARMRLITFALNSIPILFLFSVCKWYG
jgi:hypothetical protein